MSIFRKPSNAGRNQVHAEEAHLNDHLTHSSKHSHKHSHKHTIIRQSQEQTGQKILPKIENLYDIEQQDSPKGNS